MVYHMTTYMLPLIFKSHGKDTAKLLQEYFKNNSSDSNLKDILRIDLNFIDSRAQHTDFFVINDVEYIGNNKYTLHYSVDYFIYNLCKDMDINDDFFTAINFEVIGNSLCFDVIEDKRHTLDEF